MLGLDVLLTNALILVETLSDCLQGTQGQADLACLDKSRLSILHSGGGVLLLLQQAGSCLGSVLQSGAGLHSCFGCVLQLGLLPMILLMLGLGFRCLCIGTLADLCSGYRSVSFGNHQGCPKEEWNC